MIKLLVVEIPENAGRDLSVEADILGPTVEISRLAFSGDTQELANACKSADAILTDFVPLNRDMIKQLSRCQLISVAATGFNSIDLEAAMDAGINVCAIDEYCTDEVADHALTLILALCRRLMDYHQLVQREKRWQFDAFTGLARLSNLTLGIIGFGKIGQAVAKRAAGFGINVTAFDTIANDTAARELNVTLKDLNSLYAESDIVSLHCNLTDDNRGFIDNVVFRKMHKNPILINVARGELVNESDLVEALDSGKIAAAGLDVLADESPNLTNSNLTGRDNVILTPHVAFYSDASLLENRILSASNIRHHLDGHHSAVRKYVHRVAEMRS